MHKENRFKVWNNFKLKYPNINLNGKCILVKGTPTTYRDDTDHEELTRQESYFHYLFGVKEPDFYGAIDLSNGNSYLFAPKLPPAFAVWMGEIKNNQYWKDHYKVEDCFYVEDIEKTLKSLNCDTVCVISGVNTDSGLAHQGAPFEGISNFKVDKDLLFPVIQNARVVKSDKELDVMRYVAAESAKAHSEIMRIVKPGMSEFQLESHFRHLIYCNSGCRNVSYTCICGSGPNGAILHYGHAGAPNDKLIKEGEMLMFDMGGEYHCYGADISRSFPVSGRFTEEQREVYSSVLASQQAVMDAMKAGVSWPDMHRLANRVICEQLKKYNFLKGDIEDMMANYVGALFMPHGLGHLLGLDTHDVGGYPEGTSRSTEPGLKSLRYGGLLEKNMVITVEPGIYFIRAVLEPAFLNPQVNIFLNEEKIRKFLDFGGIRIEDDVIVLENGIENMSRGCPRSIEDIEALMNS
uniref:Xaa-Pro dipeptidase n=1 Tax=Arcella intermedia TaxID=1963864 RepID=A0A6B2L3E9_9EUKA